MSAYVSTYVEAAQMSDGDGDGDGVIVQIASKWAVTASHCFFRDGLQTVGCLPHYNLQQCLWKIIILFQEMITNIIFSFHHNSMTRVKGDAAHDDSDTWSPQQSWKHRHK